MQLSSEPQAAVLPQTPEEVEAVEQRWLDEVYQGHKLPELTAQVMALSVLLGALMIAFNIYMGLKTGWGEGGSIIAVILGFAIMKALGRKYSVLENNATQTFASAAGSLGNIVNVIPALILLHDDGIIPHGPTFFDVLAWVFFTSFLGVFFAIPLRRQMLVIDQLVFPTGTAAAQTIQAMHAKGAEAMKKARALATMGLGSFVLTWLRDGPGGFLPQAIMAPAKLKGIAGLSWASLNIGAAFSPMMFGAGFLVGPRVGVSLAVGGFLAWAVAAPLLHQYGIDAVMAHIMTPEAVADECSRILALDVISEEQLARVAADCKYMHQVHTGNLYGVIVKWTMWPGLGLMVAAGLTSTLMKGRIILRAIRGLFVRTGGPSPVEHLLFPTWQWALGLVISSIGIVGMLQFRFEVPWYYGLLAIGLSFLLAVIAVRATGETDINPVGAMGSVTQIAFGVAQTGSHAGLGTVTSANLLTGGVAAGGASEAADMMQDLKTGWLVGATPRRQVYAQLLGVFIGSFFCAAIFWLLVHQAPIGSAQWPAPAAITWSGLATMMAKGTSALPPYAMWALLVGTLAGIALPLAEKAAPPAVRRWLPSAVGLGVAMVVPYIYSFSIFLGSMVYLVLHKRDPEWTARYAGAVGAGGIAGEGLAGVLAAFVSLLL